MVIPVQYQASSSSSLSCISSHSYPSAACILPSIALGFVHHGRSSADVSTPSYRPAPSSLSSGISHSRIGRIRGREEGGLRREGVIVALGGDNGKQRSARREEEEELWLARRNIARAVLRPIAKLAKRKERMVQKRIEAGQEANGGTGEDMKNAVVATTLVVAMMTAIARWGGRAAVMSALGLDILKDANLEGQLDQLMQMVNELGPLKIPVFFFLWVIAKCLCIDALALVLGLASGVIFDGVIEGALYSTLFATLASLIGFQLARTYFRKQVIDQLTKRPLLRALERAVAKDGLKAVFTFRLSPMVPALPIGAYNYLYGVTSISTLDFLIGIAAGSLKPYFLDSYLGVWGEDLLRSSTSEGGEGAFASTTESTLLLGTLFILVLIGSFAAQIAGRAFDEARIEAMMTSFEGEGREAEQGEWNWWTMLGLEPPKGGLWVNEWARMETAVKEEWKRVYSTESIRAEKLDQMEKKKTLSWEERRALDTYLKQMEEATFPSSATSLSTTGSSTSTSTSNDNDQQQHRPSSSSTSLSTPAAPMIKDLGLESLSLSSSLSSSSPTSSPPPVVPTHPDGSKRLAEFPAQLVGILLFPFVLLSSATGKLGDNLSTSSTFPSTSASSFASAEEEVEGEGGGKLSA